jgi:hypothetical protein
VIGSVLLMVWWRKVRALARGGKGEGVFNRISAGDCP